MMSWVCNDIFKENFAVFLDQSMSSFSVHPILLSIHKMNFNCHSFTKCFFGRQVGYNSRIKKELEHKFACAFWKRKNKAEEWLPQLFFAMWVCFKPSRNHMSHNCFTRKKLETVQPFICYFMLPYIFSHPMN